MKDFHLKRLLSILFILAIAVVFTLQFGPGSSGFAGVGTVAPGAAAVVNGKEIPLRDFSMAYSSQLRALKSGGSPLPESLVRQMGFHQQILDRLVNIELLAQAAERHGVVPSDQELAARVHENPDFHVEGRFDFQRYQQVLRDYYRMTVTAYEEDLRRELAAIRMLELVESGATVSEDEVKARFMKEGDQAKIVFARFLPAMFAQKVPAPTAAQLEAYAKEHAGEIQSYYEANQFLYQKPERIRARQILLKVDPDAPPEKKEAAKARAQALRQELEGGKDFAELARAQTEDPGTQASGGELGWVERSALEPALADAAFALAPGSVTEPVETRHGVHLLKVEEKQPAQTQSLKDVEQEIAKTLYTKERAKALAQAEAEKALAALKSGKSLQQLFPPEKPGQPALARFEVETRPEAVETDSFNRAGESVPHLGPAPELVGAIFAAEGPQALSRAFPVGEGYVVAQVTERKRPTEQEFAAKKEALTQEARKAKRFELRDSFLKALKKRGTVVTNQEAIEAVLQAS